MFGSNFRDFVSQDPAEIKDERLTKSCPEFGKSDSGDSGNCSETEEVENRLVVDHSLQHFTKEQIAVKSKVGDLEFPLTQNLLNKVRANESNVDVKSGRQAYKDLHRMNYFINNERIDNGLVSALIKGAEDEKIGDEKKEEIKRKELNELFDNVWQNHCNNQTISNDEKTESYKVKYKKNLEEFYNKGKGYADLLPKSKNGNYHPFVEKILEEMFEYAQATIPGKDVLKELIISCNQAGYEFLIYNQIHHIFAQYKLTPTIPEKTISIRCNSVNSLNIEYNEVMVVKNLDPDQPEQYRSDNKLEFTLKLHNGKIEYENGKVTFTVPEELKKHPNGKNLLGEISEYFADADNRVVEGLIANFEQGPKSLVAVPVSNLSDDAESSFVMVYEDLSDLKKLVQNAVEDKDVSALSSYVNSLESSVKSAQHEENLPIVKKIHEIVDKFAKEHDKAWSTYVDGSAYAFLQKTMGYISHADYKIVQDLILRLNNLRNSLENKKNITTPPVVEQLISPVAANNAEPEGDSRSWSDYIDEETNKIIKEVDATEGGEQVEENVLATEEQNRVDVTIPKILDFVEDKQITHDRKDSGCGSGSSTPEISEKVPVLNDTHTPEARNAKQIIDKHNEEGFTPLHVAAQNGDVHEGERLIRLDADIEITSKTNDGDTALHLAAQKGHKDFVELLLNSGANVNSVSSTGSGATPLHKAAYDGHVDVVDLLIEHGAKIDAVDRHNYTPLMFASAQGHSEVVLYLLQKKADLYLQNDNGETALHNAAEYGHPGVASILIDAAEDKEKYVNVQSHCVGTALHIIAYNREINEEHKKVIKLLLDNGVCPYSENNPITNARQNDFIKENSLSMAITRTNTKFIEFMTSLGYSAPQVTQTKAPAQISDDTIPDNGEPGKNAQKSKLATIAILTLTATGIGMGTAAVGMYALQASLLVMGGLAGIAVCCLVAAAIVHYCTKPSNSLEGNNVTNVATHGPPVNSHVVP